MKGYFYGGQAVMEGVMMRGRRVMAVAVRDPEGEIVLHVEPIERRLGAGHLGRLPLVRGVLMLADTLRLGMRALIFSANVAARPRGVAGGPGTAPLSGPALWSTLAVSMGFAVGLFFVLPLLLVSLVDHVIAADLVSTMLEGGIRLGVLLGYLLVIGRAPEIQRVFGYHGAEHKTINAYEAGAPLTAPAVRPFGLAHPRCGTGFLLMVVLLSIGVFALLGRPPLPVRLASRLVLVPVIAALAYEYIRFTAAFYHVSVVRWLAAPSLALQRLTTREPDDSMLEVAIAALGRVLAEDGAPARAAERPVGGALAPVAAVRDD